MNSHFFYPTASGSLGDARRLGFRETLVKRELEEPSPPSSDEAFKIAARSEPTTLLAEDNDDGLHADSQETYRSNS